MLALAAAASVSMLPLVPSSTTSTGGDVVGAAVVVVLEGEVQPLAEKAVQQLVVGVVWEEEKSEQ